MDNKKEENTKSWMTMYIPDTYSKKDIKENQHKIVIDQLARVISHLEDRIIQIEKILLGSDHVYPRAMRVLKR